ncbi:hypothetical protein [Flammeovirga kamogawensis]|uniref:Uncharacterized protein n=1 Tax=Flammeovirga kamogawensis TaxID=373891 RepID=A0ABX8H4D5_9BACT|nr:hypothetical protein [Flammeovirga kamogawensis]MBB6463843.1 hypothetical protein [Flammeovirga kamogawensis]QWG10768.1 hypothetical protein KM029_26780 [Flammeovirga kamogawensis]TRX63246.1 hypothetical protein EO216_26695 [Flammeovirga kamogawensis]
MKIINHNHGKAVVFASGVIVVKLSADYYKFYATQFKSFKLTKSAIKTARKTHSVRDKENVSFSDVINIGLEYFKGVHQVRWDHLLQNQSAILDLIKNYVLAEESSSKSETEQPKETLEAEEIQGIQQISVVLTEAPQSLNGKH